MTGFLFFKLPEYKKYLSKQILECMFYEFKDSWEKNISNDILIFQIKRAGQSYFKIRENKIYYQ